MIKTVAIPARLLKAVLSPAEISELAQYGDQPMTDKEIADHIAQQTAFQAELDAKAKENLPKTIEDRVSEIEDQISKG